MEILIAVVVVLVVAVIYLYTRVLECEARLDSHFEILIKVMTNDSSLEARELWSALDDVMDIIELVRSEREVIDSHDRYNEPMEVVVQAPKKKRGRPRKVEKPYY